MNKILIGNKLLFDVTNEKILEQYFFDQNTNIRLIHYKLANSSNLDTETFTSINGKENKVCLVNYKINGMATLHTMILHSIIDKVFNIAANNPSKTLEFLIVLDKYVYLYDNNTTELSYDILHK